MSYLPSCSKFHDDQDGRLRADTDQLDDVGVIELLHDVCNMEYMNYKMRLLTHCGLGANYSD